MSNPQQGNGKTRRVAYTVIERGEGKSFWLRVGTAFENRDGSLNVYLDAIPVNGRLQIRAYAPDEERDGNQSSNANGQHERAGQHERNGAHANNGNGQHERGARRPAHPRGA